MDSSNTPVFFYIVLIVISVWGPISAVSWILYPERIQKRVLKYAEKGIAKYNPFLPQMRKKEFSIELRIGGFVLILFLVANMIICLFFWEGLFYKLIAILQVVSFIGAFLFAKFFPDRFFGKYK